MNKITKNQRLIEIIALMRDRGENLNFRIFTELSHIKVSQKTFLRDIAYLRDIRDLPIDYDPNEKVFYLKSKFVDTSFLNDGNPQLIILGTKLAETLLPLSMREKVREVIDPVILEMNDDNEDKTDFNFLASTFDKRVIYNPQVVETVFKSCILCNKLALKYCDAKGRFSDQVFSPQVMAERQGIWYLRGELLESNGRKIAKNRTVTLALHRIKEARMLKSEFIRKKHIRDEVVNDGLFDFEKVDNVKILCSPEIRQAVIEQHRHTEDKIFESKNGYVLLIIKRTDKRQIIKWMFAEQGKARVISPKSLADEICNIAQKVSAVHKRELNENTL
jgi:predicted DNA-binding transcriptional regulator YafY